MRTNYDLDVVISRLQGQNMALYNAVAALIELHPHPGQFASKYAQRLAELEGVVADIPSLMHSNGREYSHAQQEGVVTGMREMGQQLLSQAEHKPG